jgi:hypothetical protein
MSEEKDKTISVNNKLTIYLKSGNLVVFEPGEYGYFDYGMINSRIDINGLFTVYKEYEGVEGRYIIGRFLIDSIEGYTHMGDRLNEIK